MNQDDRLALAALDVVQTHTINIEKNRPTGGALRSAAPVLCRLYSAAAPSTAAEPARTGVSQRQGLE
jgi:hypothetical protein